MYLRIASRKLDSDFDFWLENSSLKFRIRPSTPDGDGLEGRGTCCAGGRELGNVIFLDEFDWQGFERACRSWYRSFLRQNAP